MLKIKDWLKNKGDIQFYPIDFRDFGYGQTIEKVVRIIDGVEFGLIINSGVDRYYFDKENDNTIKGSIGITKFHENQTHVNLACMCKILNTKFATNHIKREVPINDVEKYYNEVFNKAKEEILKLSKPC